MTDCSSCGACCDPIATNYSPPELKIEASRGNEEACWILENTDPLPRKVGKRLFDDYGDGTPLIGVDLEGNIDLTGAFFYACHHFDQETRQCTNYENRPEMCREWPSYGKPLDPLKFLPTPCSFRADIGKPITPIEVVLQSRKERLAREAAG